MFLKILMEVLVHFILKLEKNVIMSQYLILKLDIVVILIIYIKELSFVFLFLKKLKKMIQE